MVYIMLRFFSVIKHGIFMGKIWMEHHLEDFPLPSGGFPEDQRVLRLGFSGIGINRLSMTFIER